MALFMSRGRPAAGPRSQPPLGRPMGDNTTGEKWERSGRDLKQPVSKAAVLRSDNSRVRRQRIMEGANTQHPLPYTPHPTP